MSQYQEPKCDNPETSILQLKPWNSVTHGTGHQISQVELRFQQHVLVFTVTKRFVSFIYIIDYTL